MFLRSTSILALAGVLAVPAFAAEAPVALASSATAAAEAASDAQGDIVVTGQREEYGAASTRSATRTDTAVRNIPQAMTIVSEAQIEDQDLRSIAQLLTYVPGATPGTGEGNRDQITLRGNNTTADFFVDGIRDDVQYFRDLYNLDRVEVLRGPNAMIFGRGGGGGVVNRVTKRASGIPFRQFSLSGDTDGGYRLTGDVDLRLGANAGLRVNGVYENGESFRHGVELERYGINPTIGLNLGEATRIDLSYEYFHDRRTADRGIPAFNDRPLEGSDAIFFGDPRDSYSDADVHLATFAIEHRFDDDLVLRNRTQYGDYDKFYQNVFATELNEATGMVALSAYNNVNTRRNLISQTDLVWETRLGGVDQILLLGFEIGRQDSLNRRFNGFFQPGDTASIQVPVDAPTIDADLIFRPVNTNAARTPAAYSESEASILAAYVQDQIRLGDAVELIAGLRFDRFTLDAVNLNNGERFSRTDDLVSPRIGLIVRPVPSLTFYAAYGRSYLPSAGDQFSSLDLTSEALKPERFDNYELGAKWEPIEGLLATAAIYRLDRTNSRAAGPVPGTIVLTGAQRSRGLELGLERHISHRWRVSAGYAWQKAEIRRDTAAAPAGREVPLVPRHQFSFWNRYDFTPRFGAGLGIVAASGSYAGLGNAVRLPSFVRADAAFYVQLAEGIQAQVNVENLFGEDYFPTAHSDNNIAPGAPRTARATLRFQF
jgi:catecholate siderophore receptor